MSACIEFEGYCLPPPGNYGQVGIAEGRLYGTRRAHRVAWIKAHGPIPTGLVVRHICDNPPCVNVDHLVLGTDADNIHDMHERGRYRGGRKSGVQTHCKRGHEYTPENTYTQDGHRSCVTCRHERHRRWL
jgi:hypothetical protein